MSEHHFDNTAPPEPPEPLGPYVFDVLDIDAAWQGFERRLTILERLDKAEQRITELEARLDQKPQAFRVYPERDSIGDEQC